MAIKINTKHIARTEDAGAPNINAIPTRYTFPIYAGCLKYLYIPLFTILCCSTTAIRYVHIRPKAFIARILSSNPIKTRENPKYKYSSENWLNKTDSHDTQMQITCDITLNRASDHF